MINCFVIIRIVLRKNSISYVFFKEKFYLSPLWKENPFKLALLPACSLVALSVGVYNRYLGGIDSYPVKAWIFTGFFSIIAQPFNSQDLIVYSPLLLLHITLFISYENLVLDQDDICQIILCICNTCLLDNVWTFLEKFHVYHFWELKG